MKKILFFAALAATMASCTSDEALDVSNSYAIGFDTYVGKTTRAGDLNTSSLTSFYVYGGTSALEFKGTNVTKQNNAWTYYPTQYWEEGAKYKFAAVAPVKDNASYDYASNKLTVANYAGGDDDLIVATTNEITGQASGSNALVGLNFKHALSKVQISFSGLDASKVPTNVKITNVSNKANLEVGYNTGTAPSWGTASATGDFEYTINATTGKGVKYLLPQTLADNTKIKYTYDSKDIELNIKTADVAEWEMGKAYNYNITLSDENAINFEVTVTEWPTIGDEPAQTDPETPEEPKEEPGDEPIGDDETPETIILVGNEKDGIIDATYIRSDATNQRYNDATKTTSYAMEIKWYDPKIKDSSSTDDVKHYFGLLGITLPSDLKKAGYKLNAKLRLVTTTLKDSENFAIYEFVEGTTEDGNTCKFNESAKYEKGYGDYCLKLTEGTSIVSFEAKGHMGKGMGDTGVSEEYKTVDAWTNYIDISDFINKKISSSDQGSTIGFIINKAAADSANNPSKFATERAIDITNSSLNVTFEAKDLYPQLIITYTKE